MAADKLDEMRKKLRLDGLAETQKKAMFQKFVDAGGQVVELNPRQRKKADDKKKAQTERRLNELKSSIEKREALENQKEPGRKGGGLGAIDLSPEAQKQNPVNLWIERIASRLGCVFSGILQLNEENITASFRDLVLNEYQTQLLNSRMILASVLYQDKTVANEMKKRFFMDTVFPYYYELIFRYDNLFQDELFQELETLRRGQLPEKELKSLFKRVYVPLFILQPYYYSLKTSVEKALIMEKDLRRLNSATAYENIKKLYGCIDFVFTRFYPRLHMLMDYFYKSDERNRRLTFKEYIGYADAEGIGVLTAGWKEEMQADARREEEHRKRLLNAAAGTEAPARPGEKKTEEEKALEEASDSPMKRGLRLIEKHIQFRAWLNQFQEKKDVRALFTLKDKVFLTYCLVDFFDKEYSFLINSNKVEYNVVFLEGKRLDTKRDLMDTYFRINSLFERVNEYLKIVKEIRKVENDSFVSMQEKSARLNQYSLQRSQVSRTIRKEARDFFEEFSRKFVPVVSDFYQEKKIVQNADTVVDFDDKLQGTRVVNGKRVMECVEEAYHLASAAAYLLVDGDLGGYSLLLEKPIYLNLNLYE